MKKTKTHTSTTYTLELTPEDLIAYIRGYDDDVPVLEIPPGAEFSVQVPGGGDYSNTKLYFDLNETIITITWTEVTNHEE